MKERDEAAGIHREPTFYATATQVPAFPISPTALLAQCKPAAVELLKQPARPDKPAQMRRVA